MPTICERRIWRQPDVAEPDRRIVASQLRAGLSAIPLATVSKSGSLPPRRPIIRPASPTPSISDSEPMSERSIELDDGFVIHRSGFGAALDDDGAASATSSTCIDEHDGCSISDVSVAEASAPEWDSEVEAERILGRQWPRDAIWSAVCRVKHRMHPVSDPSHSPDVMLTSAVPYAVGRRELFPGMARGTRECLRQPGRVVPGLLW